jgi:hypothetical protein
MENEIQIRGRCESWTLGIRIKRNGEREEEFLIQ